MSAVAPPALEVRRLAKRFEPRAGRGEAFWAIRDLSFAVGEGELLTIVGPSGSGKSTLLNLIAQIDAPSDGEIRFRGRPIASPTSGALRPGWDRQFGYVTQEDTLLPWRTLAENVLFPLRVQGRLDAGTRERAARLIRAAGLEGFERYYPHELSGGMRKRGALIRTLVYDPPVILMDEPFGALDVLTREVLQQELLRIWARNRKSVLFVTHSIEESILLADRIVVFSRGPGRVKEVILADLPRPRQRGDRRFVELTGHIRSSIYAELGAEESGA